MVDKDLCKKDGESITRSDLRKYKCESKGSKYLRANSKLSDEERGKRIKEINKELIKTFDTTLNQNRLVMISYCTGFLRKPTDSMNYDSKKCDPDKKRAHGRHASVVIGQRCKDDKRQYLIQNSWGNQCDSYGDHFDCNSREGNFWVSEDILFPNTYRVARLVRKAGK